MLLLSKFYVTHKNVAIFAACITYKIMIFMNYLKSLEIISINTQMIPLDTFSRQLFERRMNQIAKF